MKSPDLTFARVAAWAYALPIDARVGITDNPGECPLSECARSQGFSGVLVWPEYVSWDARHTRSTTAFEREFIDEVDNIARCRASKWEPVTAADVQYILDVLAHDHAVRSES